MHYKLSAATAAAVAQLLRKAVEEYPPVAHSATPTKQRTHYLLGSQLITLGYLSLTQLMQALDEQRERRQHEPAILLGGILVEHQLVHPKVLTAVLLTQMVERLFINDALTPKMLGEHLVLSGRIAPIQIASAIQSQLQLAQQGQHVRLGDLLIKQGLLDKKSLAAALELQRQQHEYSIDPL